MVDLEIHAEIYDAVSLRNCTRCKFVILPSSAPAQTPALDGGWGGLGYSKKLKFWIWTLVTQGIFVMTLLDNLSQKFAPKKHIFPSLIANSFYKGICSKIQRKSCFFSFLNFLPNFLSGEWFYCLWLNLSDRYGSFDTHIDLLYDVLCLMAYVIKCHKMPYFAILWHFFYISHMA